MDFLEHFCATWLRWSPRGIFNPILVKELDVQGVARKDLVQGMIGLADAGFVGVREVVGQGGPAFQLTIKGYLEARKRGILPPTDADGDRIVSEYIHRHPELMDALAADA